MVCTTQLRINSSASNEVPLLVILVVSHIRVRHHAEAVAVDPRERGGRADMRSHGADEVTNNDSRLVCLLDALPFFAHAPRLTRFVTKRGKEVLHSRVQCFHNGLGCTESVELDGRAL